MSGRRVSALLAGLALVLLLGAPAAQAHGGGAGFPTLEATEIAPGRVEVRVEVVHESDGHPAEGALVEVSATGPSGRTLGPVEAERQAAPGLHLVGLDVAEAGAWTISVVSSFPPGVAELPVAVALDAPDDDAATTTTAPVATTDTTTAGPAAPDGGDDGAAEGDDVPGRVESDDTVNWVVAGVFGLLGGGLGLWVSNRRGARRRAARAGGEG